MSTLVTRGSKGLKVLFRDDSTNPPKWREDPARGLRDESKNVKYMDFDPNGDSLAWSNGGVIKTARFESNGWKASNELPHSKVSFLSYSPKGNFVSTWEVFAKKPDQKEDLPNFFIWNAKTGEKVAGFVQKKVAFWQPQWTKDESLCSILSADGGVAFYKNGDFSQVDKRLTAAHMKTYSLSPNGSSHNIVVFIPGVKGAPSLCRMFTYPNFHHEKDVVANKSFFQADDCNVEWSSDGKHALILSSSEVDKTNASYYGKQQLHYINSKGDTAMVELSKQGPIYSNKWTPAQNAQEFVVVYGFMPSKATIFNTKCEKVFDFGTGNRNQALFNPQGNLLLLGGFGNLSGGVEIWSVRSVGVKQEVCKFEAPDSTDVRWSSDGKHIMTSTCAPRLRIQNGLKVWHYSGSLLFEDINNDTNPNDELWEVAWRNAPLEKNPPFAVDYTKVPGISSQTKVASKQAYVPPSMRNKAGGAGRGPIGAQFKVEDGVAKRTTAPPGAPTGNNDAEKSSVSKSAAKNKRRKDMAKAKKAEAGSEGQQQQGQSQPQQQQSTTQQQPKAAKSNNTQNQTTNGGASASASKNGSSSGSTGNPEKDKKIRKLNEKLQQIQKLKAKQAEGVQLEINQLEKIKKENEIVAEMNQLRL